MQRSHPYLFNLQTPIIQAPMAGVSTPMLAAHVSNAGGLGSIAIGASSTSEARRMIQETRALTNHPFNVNVFCHAPAQRDLEIETAWLNYLTPLFAKVEEKPPATLNEIYPSFLRDHETFTMLLEEKPAIVSFHFGIPSTDKLLALRQAGIKTLATATSVSEALQIEKAGIDALVAQGIEAGGHRGVFDPHAPDEQLSTMVLIRLLTRQIRLPVIAAGGIMDGYGIKAALDLGAVAAQLGTAFILCPESSANENYRRNLKNTHTTSTRLTSVISGRPARGIVNEFIQYADRPGSPSPASYPVAYDATKRLNAAALKRNNHNFAVQWAGQGSPLSRELTATKLVETLLQEMSTPETFLGR